MAETTTTTDPQVAETTETTETAPTPETVPAQGQDNTEADPALGEAGKKALAAERDRAKQADTARKAAEKAAREAHAELKKLNDEKLSETEKLQRQADEGRTLSEKATEKLRRANLLSAVSDKGLQGGKAKAAARLLSGRVEFDDQDEPANLDDAITSASVEFGAELFKASATPVIPVPDPNQLHAGPRVDAQPSDAQKVYEASRARMRA